jgi:hypothetical protein
VPFTDEHLATLRTKLGLAADADEDKIVATVTEVMDEFVKDRRPAEGQRLPEGTVASTRRFSTSCARTPPPAGRPASSSRPSAASSWCSRRIKDGRIAPASPPAATSG